MFYECCSTMQSTPINGMKGERCTMHSAEWSYCSRGEAIFHSRSPKSGLKHETNWLKITPTVARLSQPTGCLLK